MPKNIFLIIYITIIVVGCSTKHIVIDDENIIAPKLIDKPIFIYPHKAKENNFTGKVHLIIKIDKTGNIDSVLLEKSSTHDILDKSAIAFAKKFIYKPAELNGQPIQFYMKQSVDFSLAEDKSQAQDYFNHIKELKKNIEKALPEKQHELQKELLFLYRDFINSNLDFVIFNQNVRELVNKDSYNRWDEAINDWPLHFIVFDDFLKSYPNSSVDNDARGLMFEYLKKDFETIKIISMADKSFSQKRDQFNQKIHSFLNEEYADVLPDSLNYLIQ